MAEEQVVVQAEQPTQVAPPAESPFGNNAWTETVPEFKEETQVVTPTVTEPTPAVTPTPKEEEEILDPKEWLKREFETDDIEVLKAERAELKKLREQPAAEYKFENDESKRLAEAISKGDRKEVRKILETQERLESFTTAEVNKDNADDIIKMGMQLKYKDLTPSEINYKFNKEFSVPKPPVQRADELDDEFTERQTEWQSVVADIETNKIIEAKLAKPELEKAKANLVLPELTKQQPESNANQQDPEVLQKARDKFLQALESNYNKAEGFSTQVKDESVEIPISFKIPDEEKVAIKERLKQGFDVDGYFDSRWFDQNGEPKIEQMISDLYILENRDKVHSGIANDSANKRLSKLREQTSNVTVKNNAAQTTFAPSENGQGRSPFDRNAWSEKPAVLQ